MSNGISHQVSNRVSCIHSSVGFIDFLLKGVLDKVGKDKIDEKVLEKFDKHRDIIKHSCKDAREIMENFMQYSRPTEEASEDLDIELMLKTTKDVMRYKTDKTKVRVDVRVSEEIKIIRGTRLLNEVWINLISNSCDAIEEYQEKNKEKEHEGIIEIDVYEEKENVVLKFKDNGIGVKDEDIVKLFAPYFTTKMPSKEGYGIGLYAIRNIVESHGGTIQMESEYLKGATTKVCLPLSKKKEGRREGGKV